MRVKPYRSVPANSISRVMGVVPAACPSSSQVRNINPGWPQENHTPPFCINLSIWKHGYKNDNCYITLSLCRGKIQIRGHEKTFGKSLLFAAPSYFLAGFSRRQAKCFVLTSFQLMAMLKLNMRLQTIISCHWFKHVLQLQGRTLVIQRPCSWLLGVSTHRWRQWQRR